MQAVCILELLSYRYILHVMFGKGEFYNHGTVLRYSKKALPAMR